MHVVFHSRVAGLVLAAALLAGTAGAQTLTLPNGQVYKAGPDYASDVLQDPWDFNNGDDVAPDPEQVRYWTAPDAVTVRSVGTVAFLANGRFGGTPGQGPSGEPASLALLYRADAMALNPGRSGARDPIDTARYRKLAVKMSVAASPGPIRIAGFWSHSSIGEPNWGYRGGSAYLSPVIPAGSSEQVYVLDLSQASPVNFPGAAYTAESLVRGFGLYPSEVPVSSMTIDWVRLTASNADAAAALMPVALSACSTFQSLTITDVAGVQTVITDSTGNNSNRSFNYGIFPPGTYNVRATCGNGTTPAETFVINTPPIVTVLDPDETGDPSTDYAPLNRGGDRWDFEQLTDVARSFNVTTTGGACGATGPCGIVPAEPPGTGHMLRASSSELVGDPGLEMLNGAIVPLNSRKHRILTFSLRNRRPYLLTALVGPVLRILWGSEALGTTMTASQDMRVWPGFNRYTVDLGALTGANGGIETECPGCPTIPWMARAIRHFRIDPHEYGDVPTTFDIDDMTLTAPDSVAIGQQFIVRYGFTDVDSAGAIYTARVYRESWPDRTSRVQLATIPGVAPGQVLTYTFDSSGLPAGEYGISVEIDELRGGLVQTSRADSTGALVLTNPAASSPHLSVSTPTPNQNLGVPFTIQGCAYDDGAATGGINVDDIAVRMRAIAGPRAGAVIGLGYDYAYPGTGALQFAPLGTPVPCPTASGAYAQSGFRVANIGVNSGTTLYGTWMIDVFVRSSISGELIQLPEIPIQIGPAAPAGPTNFQASAGGNTVTVSWDAPGPGVAYYQVQGSLTPSFTPLAFQVDVPGTGPYSGQLASGTYYLRVYARSASGQWSAPSATRVVNVALPQLPGPPVLVAAQVASNPVTLTWSPGPGGAPSSYTIYAGTSPGASNLAVAPVGLANAISANAPANTPIYVRVVAANAAGQATSNEISFTLTSPSAPTMSPAVVANGSVTLQWTPVANASGYVVIARYPNSPTIIATLPMSGTTLTVPAPAGTYLVSVVATNPQGTSAESNQVTVVVP